MRSPKASGGNVIMSSPLSGSLRPSTPRSSPLAASSNSQNQRVKWYTVRSKSSSNSLGRGERIGLSAVALRQLRINPGSYAILYARNLDDELSSTSEAIGAAAVEVSYRADEHGKD
jgi:hypothetical protein